MTSLVPNAPAMETMVNGLLTKLTEVGQFGVYVTAFATGPQQINGDGFSATIDPFANATGFKQALYKAQQDSGQFSSNVMMPLYEWMGGTVPAYSSTFTSDTNGILSTINSIGSGTPTAAQAQTITAALQTVASGLQPVSDGMSGLKSSLVSYQKILLADTNALLSGGASIDAAIAQVNAQMSSVMQQYAGTPFGLAMIETVTGIGALEVQKLNALKTQLQTVTASGQSAYDQITSILDTLAQLQGQYQEVADSIADAQSDQVGSLYQQLDIQDAQSAWQTLAQNI